MVFDSLIVLMIFTNILVSIALLFYVKKHSLPIYSKTVKEKKDTTRTTDTQQKHKIRYFSDEELWEKTRGR